MTVLALIIEISGYVIMIALIFSLWAVILTSTFNWLSISNRSALPRILRKITDPQLLFLKKRLPFLVQKNLDFTPVLAIFIIIFLHLVVVDTLLQVAVRLK